MIEIRVLIFLSIFFTAGQLSAQDLKPWFASEIEVVDSLDPQIMTCLAYKLGDTVIYDTPQSLRLYPNQYYHLKFRFNLF